MSDWIKEHYNVWNFPYSHHNTTFTASSPFARQHSTTMPPKSLKNVAPQALKKGIVQPIGDVFKVQKKASRPKKRKTTLESIRSRAPAHHHPQPHGRGLRHVVRRARLVR